MEIVEIPIQDLREAPWNPNQMGEEMLAKLRRSITRYGLVENLVVRPMGSGAYEVLSGNQRLKLLQEMSVKAAPCVVVELNNVHARLLAQALNHIKGEDDLGLRAELVRNVLASLSQQEVVELLPETAQSLNELASLGQETLAAYLENWQKAQAARLRHVIFQVTPLQEEVVQEALSRVMPEAAKEGRRDNPNLRGTALYLLCKSFLERVDHEGCG